MAGVLPWGPEPHIPSSEPGRLMDLVRVECRVNHTPDRPSALARSDGGRTWDIDGLDRTGAQTVTQGGTLQESQNNF
eukprot:2358762-Prymnesium_polylepis.1